MKKKTEHFGLKVMATFQLIVSMFKKWGTLPSIPVSWCRKKRVSFHRKLTHCDPIGHLEPLLLLKNLRPPSCPHEGTARPQAMGPSWTSPSTAWLPLDPCPCLPPATRRGHRPLTWKRMSCSSRRCLFLSLQMERGICSNMGPAVDRSTALVWRSDGCRGRLCVEGPGRRGCGTAFLRDGG